MEKRRQHVGLEVPALQPNGLVGVSTYRTLSLHTANGPSQALNLTHCSQATWTSVWNTSVTEHLGKQCQLLDLLSDLEAKCKEVSEFGFCRLWDPGLCGGIGRASLSPEAALSPVQWHLSQALM